MTARLRALLIEDNAIVLENLCAMLGEMSAVDVVGTVGAEDEACQWLDSRTQACDIAIVDMFLRGGNGIGVLKHMATYERPPERVVLTNYATEQVRSQCLSFGATAVFDKSTEIEELVEFLASRVRH